MLTVISHAFHLTGLRPFVNAWLPYVTPAPTLPPTDPVCVRVFRVADGFEARVYLRP